VLGRSVDFYSLIHGLAQFTNGHLGTFSRELKSTPLPDDRQGRKYRMSPPPPFTRNPKVWPLTEPLPPILAMPRLAHFLLLKSPRQSAKDTSVHLHDAKPATRPAVPSRSLASQNRIQLQTAQMPRAATIRPTMSPTRFRFRTNCRQPTPAPFFAPLPESQRVVKNSKNSLARLEQPCLRPTFGHARKRPRASIVRMPAVGDGGGSDEWEKGLGRGMKESVRVRARR
jgi:hypothetical protein